MIFHELSSLDGDQDWALLVDTSTSKGQLMAFNNSRVLYDKTWGKESKHDQILNPTFAELKKDIDLKSLKKIICVYGPGSFTGLRVSATFAKILSLSLKEIPIYGLSSFHLYAYGVIKHKLVAEKENFDLFISSIGTKTFKSSFKFNEKLNYYEEVIDLEGSKVHDLSQPSKFLISELDASDFFNNRRDSLLKNSPVLAHVQKFTYLDFYPLFLRRSEAEEKLKI